MPDASQTELTEIAQTIRRSIIVMLAQAGSGHPGGALGMADIFTALYFAVAHHDPQNPAWDERDYILLSNGHICPVLYATLAEAGYFPFEELFTLRQLGSRLQGHPHRGSLPGIENTSGPLAQGLSQACGLALSLKRQGKPNHVFCLMSDGEQQEGQVWEAYLFAAKYQLTNLTVIIDRNNIQIDGTTDSVMPLGSLAAKLQAFDWQTQEINGNNFREVLPALQNAKDQQLRAETQKPLCIIAHTTPGKGVTFMEGKYQWHGTPPTKEQAEEAVAELMQKTRT